MRSHTPSADQFERQLIDNESSSIKELNTQYLEEELTDARLLQKLSLELVAAEDTSVLYQKFVDAAVAIMKSQYASMQMLHEERNSPGQLKLLASNGFSPEA